MLILCLTESFEIYNNNNNSPLGTSYSLAPAALSCTAKEMPGVNTEVPRTRALLVVDYIKDRS